MDNIATLEKLVTDMHEFFSVWFSGKIEKDEVKFAKFKDLMDPGFTLINPDATVSTFQMVVDQMDNYYGKVPGLVVETEGFNVVAGDGDLVVATYDELQRWPEGANSRRSTVLFVAQADSPYGYRWRHAQETWLDAGTSGQN